MSFSERVITNKSEFLKCLKLFNINTSKYIESNRTYRRGFRKNTNLAKKLMVFSIISSMQLSSVQAANAIAPSSQLQNNQTIKTNMTQKSYNFSKTKDNYINVEIVPVRIIVNGREYSCDGFTSGGKSFVSPSDFLDFINNGTLSKKTITQSINVSVDKTQFDSGEIVLDEKLYVSLKQLAQELGYEVFWDQKSKEIIAAKKDYLLGLVKPVWISAVINRNTKVYKNETMKEEIGTLPKGTKVVLVQDRDRKKANIKTDKINGWIKYSDIDVSKTNYIKNKKLPAYVKEYFVNEKQFISDTNKLIWVNLENTTVNVFEKSENGWKLQREYPCSIGKNTTPTINGVFKYERIVEKEKHDGYYVKDVMKFYKAFGLHSVLMKNEKTYYDGRLNQAISNGCLRLLPKDIEWISNNCEKGTTVVVW